MRLVYLVPEDREPRDAYRRAIEMAARHLRVWYREAMGNGMTFTLGDPIVEVAKTPHPERWYATHATKSDRTQWFWENVLADGFAATGGRFDDPTNRWVFYIDAEHDPGQSVGAAAGVALLPEHDLVGLVGGVMPGHVQGVPRWVGGLGHELGHALGLPHPESQGRELMWLGYLDYPKTFLLEEEREFLSRSPFFTVQETEPMFDVG